MKRHCTTALILACFAAAAPAGAAQAASFKACSGSFQPDGTPGGGFYGKIRARGVSCVTARKVTQTWVRKMASGAQLPTARITVMGYRCKGAAPTENTLVVRCDSGAKAVIFRGQP
jgi:hypothetical protein